MKIINQIKRKGEIINFDTSDLLEELRKVNENSYYLYFTNLIDLDVLELKILKHIIKDNKQITFQSKAGNIKTFWLLSWDKFCCRLIYRDEQLRYTLIFSRSGVMIYPNSLNCEECLKLSLHFLNTLEMGGCLR